MQAMDLESTKKYLIHLREVFEGKAILDSAGPGIFTSFRIESLLTCTCHLLISHAPYGEPKHSDCLNPRQSFLRILPTLDIERSTKDASGAELASLAWSRT